MADEIINPQRVRKEMDEMIEMITHPAFVAAMKRMKDTPVGERQALGKKTLTVAALTASGVRMPAGMRVTTRYFERGKPEVIEVSPDGKVRATKTPLFPLGIPDGGTVSWGGCACGGGLTFCGGAGGGT